MVKPLQLFLIGLLCSQCDLQQVRKIKRRPVGSVSESRVQHRAGPLVRRLKRRKYKRPALGQDNAIKDTQPAKVETVAEYKYQPVSSNRHFFQASTTIRPENMPFTVNQSVPIKEDSVKRFLSLFTIVSFKNDACTSSGGTNGTCYSSNDCSSLGGSASGTCASGFGVCCLFTATCGGVTSVNGTYFQNSGYPSTFDSVGSCRLTVNKCSEDVCQLRLDIEQMTLAGPQAVDNNCMVRKMSVQPCHC